MKRMIANAQILELISKHMIYNPETNTMELGVNVEIDGNAQVNGVTEMQLFYDGEIEDATGETQDNGSVYVLPFYKETTVDEVYEYGLMFINFGSGTFIGVGYWNLTSKGFEIDATGDISDTFYHISGTLANDNRFQIMYDSYITQNNLPQYFHHELEITLANNTKIYLNYPSTQNLVIDSLQDLTAVVKPMTDTKLGYGNGYLFYENNIWKNNSGTLVTAVSDNVEVID